MTRFRSLSIIVALALFTGLKPLSAQVSAGGSPPSLLRSADLGPAPAALVFARPDVDALLLEDEQEGKDVPLRFGTPHEVSFSPQDSGQWDTLADGTRIWRLALHCDGATSTNLIYENFLLPHGADFFVYTPDHATVLGAFTEFNNKPDGVFATQPLPGEDCVLEYVQPADVRFNPDFRVVSVIHGYRDIFGFARDASRDYNDSGNCNNNVNCPEGTNWTEEINSVAMILTGGGFRVCTGAMINNVREDQTQYFLTANHCLGGETSWIFMFNYQSAGCGNQDGPTTDTVQGAILRASHSDSDFALLELTEPIPFNYNVTYSGWDRRDQASTASVCVHHPSGDIKKISFDNDPVDNGTWSGTPANSHWHIAAWDDGTTEPGSSGSPLYNPNHQIVGQLHGGQANCSNNVNDYYGKFSLSWDGHSGNNQQLKHWLDPDNTGTDTIGGSESNPTDRPNLLADGNQPLDPEDLLNPGFSGQFIVHLQNTGLLATGITGTLSTLSNLINITDTQGSWPDLPNITGAWNTDNPFRFSISPEAPLGSLVNLSVTLTADEGYTVTRTFSIEIGVREVFLEDDFSTNQGWTLGEGWQMGVTTAGGGQSGDPDPALDHSPSADNNVLGFILGGDYPNNMTETSWAYSPLYDLSNRLDTQIQFYRWLGIEANFWDQVTLQVWDGASWVELWSNSQDLSDGLWLERIYDVSDWADGNPAFQIRFGLGPTNGNTTFCGWNVDDLSMLAFNTDIPIVYDPPLAAAPLREGNDLVFNWTPQSDSPYYRVEWRRTSDVNDSWQTIAWTDGPQLRVSRGYALLGPTGLFRVFATDRVPPRISAVSAVDAESLLDD
ncbi:MAG: trypsin-like serine protease [Calditrichaeota bacterium]|nr:trypsin-like serine protease [Calditrichota bacterium]